MLSPSRCNAIQHFWRRNPTEEAAKTGFSCHRWLHSSQAYHWRGEPSHSVDADTFIGKRDDISGKVVVSWDIFRGGQDSWRRAEMAERYTEETMRHARLQRDALELMDKAWAAGP